MIDAELASIKRNDARIRPAHFYSEHAIQKAAERCDLIKPIVEAGPPYRQAVRRASATAALAESTIYRAIAKFSESRDLRSLVRKSRQPSFRIPKEVLDVVRGLFEARYRHKQRISKGRFATEVRMECKVRRYHVPGRSTVIRHLDRLVEECGLRAVEHSRGNKKRAEAMTARQGTFSVPRPLEVYEIDHTPLDIEVVDEETRTSIRRPFITVAIDVASRMIAGIYLSLDPVGMNSVGLCLYNAICRKEPYLERLGLAGSQWPIFGVPAVIHTDNAKEFIGQGLARFAKMRDIRLEHRPVGAPRFGGHVERVIGTINQEVHNWPGTTHSNVQKRGDYNSEKHALFTLPELEAKLVNWITGKYHNSKHRTLGRTPMSVYADALLGDEHSFGIGIPEDVDESRLRFDLLPTRACTVQRTGVALFGFTYVGEAVSAYCDRRDSKGRSEQFRVAYDPGYMNEIYLYAHDVNEYYRLQLREERPHITLWDAKILRKKLREDGREASEEAIFAAYQRDEKLNEQAGLGRKTAATARVRRKREQRKIAGIRRVGVAAGITSKTDDDVDWSEMITPIDGTQPI